MTFNRRACKTKIKINFDILKLKNNFNAFANLGTVFYTLKSNSEEVLLKELLPYLTQGNHGFAVAKPEHFLKLIKLGVSPARINLINVLASDAFIKELYKAGVRNFTFDNTKTLLNFAKYANISECKMHVRLNINEIFPNALGLIGEKIHLGASTEEALTMCGMLKTLKCKDFGVSFYLQKELNLEQDALNKALLYIENNFYSFGLKFINIGGARTPEELKTARLLETKKKLGVEYILLEPGRYLAGNTMDMETGILRTKQIQGAQIVVLQNGIYSGLLDRQLYGKNFEMYLDVGAEHGAEASKTALRYTKIENEKTRSATYPLMLCGNSCDSGDRLGLCYIDGQYAPFVNEGATVLIKDVGTYFSGFFMELGGEYNIEYNIIGRSEPSVNGQPPASAPSAGISEQKPVRKTSAAVSQKPTSNV